MTKTLFTHFNHQIKSITSLNCNMTLIQFSFSRGNHANSNADFRLTKIVLFCPLKHLAKFGLRMQFCCYFQGLLLSVLSKYACWEVSALQLRTTIIGFGTRNPNSTQTFFWPPEKIMLLFLPGKKRHLHTRRYSHMSHWCHTMVDGAKFESCDTIFEGKIMSKNSVKMIITNGLM